MDRFYFFIFCCCSVCACGGGCGGGGGGHPCGEKVYRSLFGAVGTHIFLGSGGFFETKSICVVQKINVQPRQGKPAKYGLSPFPVIVAKEGLGKEFPYIAKM